MSGQIVDAKIVVAPKERNTSAEKKAIKEGRVPQRTGRTSPPGSRRRIATSAGRSNARRPILFDKFGMHAPLNCQSTRFNAEGIDPPLSTLADQVGHDTFALKPVFDLIETHVLAAERLHGDDTTVPILAKGKCSTGRIWAYVRDDGTFAGPAPPAALYYASSDRRGEPPQKHLAGFAGILQCDCYGGFEPLFDPQRKDQPITPAFCFGHARRGFFELADIAKKARDGVKGKPLLDEMQAWLLRERETLSRSA